MEGRIIEQCEKLNIESTIEFTQSPGHATELALSAVDQKIIDSISDSRVHIDDLISSTGLSSADILSALTKLELKGIVQQYPGKFFSLKK